MRFSAISRRTNRSFVPSRCAASSTVSRAMVVTPLSCGARRLVSVGEHRLAGKDATQTRQVFRGRFRRGSAGMWQELAVNGRGRCWTAGVGQEDFCVDNAVRRVVPGPAKVPPPGEMAGDTRERVSRLQLSRRLLL